MWPFSLAVPSLGSSPMKPLGAGPRALGLRLAVPSLGSSPMKQWLACHVAEDDVLAVPSLGSSPMKLHHFLLIDGLLLTCSTLTRVEPHETLISLDIPLAPATLPVPTTSPSPITAT